MKHLNKLLSAAILSMPFISGCAHSGPLNVYGPAPDPDTVDGETAERVVYGPGSSTNDAKSENDAGTEEIPAPVYGPGPGINDAHPEPDCVYGPSGECRTQEDCDNFAAVWHYAGTWYCDMPEGEQVGTCREDSKAADGHEDE